VSLGLPLDAFSQDQNEPLRSRILLTPHREAVLSSQIPAKIDSINVEEGDRFKSGQILISLDCVLHRSRRDKAKAERDAASKTLDAQTRLQNMGSGSELELDLAGTTLAKANAEFSVSNAMVKMCSIKAPFRGRVASRKANAHQYVQAGEPLLEIIDDTLWEIKMIVPSTWLRWLSVGHKFQLHMDETDQQYSAEVTQIGARIDPASQSIKVVGKILGEHKGLLAGMSGTALLAE